MDASSWASTRSRKSIGTGTRSATTQRQARIARMAYKHFLRRIVSPATAA